MIKIKNRDTKIKTLKRKLKKHFVDKVNTKDKKK